MSDSKQGKILIVDDNEDLLKAAKMFLKRNFAQVDIEKNPEAIPGLMGHEQYDVILLDMNFTKDVSSGSEGYYWLEKILGLDPSAVVVLITAYGDVQMAVKAIKAGATDFVLKPWENDKLLATLYSSMRLRESRDQVQTLKTKNHEINQAINEKYIDIIGQSQAMQNIFHTVERVAQTDANVLILGENGTGRVVRHGLREGPGTGLGLHQCGPASKRGDQEVTTPGGVDLPGTGHSRTRGECADSSGLADHRGWTDGGDFRRPDGNHQSGEAAGGDQSVSGFAASIPE